MNRIALGDFEVIAVSDGSYYLDGGAFFGIIPKVLWEKKLPANERNLVRTGLNSIVVRTGKKTVLIETGVGNKLSEKMVKIFGQPAELLTNLASAGIAPGDIDIVINSHLHFDHCGWNTILQAGELAPTFPNARYYAQHSEWRHVHAHERDAASCLPENYDPLVESGQMELLQGNGEIVPGISVQIFPGHTRDMQAILIESKGQTACYISDLIPTTAHLDLNWVMGFDLYPMQTIESRKRYYARAIPEKWLTLFTHDPEVPWAYVQEGEKGKLVARKLESVS